MLATSFINPFAWALGVAGFLLQRRWFRRADPKRRKKTLALWLGLILWGEVSLAESVGIGAWFTSLVMYHLFLCLIFGGFLAVLVYEVPAWLQNGKKNRS